MGAAHRQFCGSSMYNWYYSGKSCIYFQMQEYISGNLHLLMESVNDRYMMSSRSKSELAQLSRHYLTSLLKHQLDNNTVQQMYYECIRKWQYLPSPREVKMKKIIRTGKVSRIILIYKNFRIRY